MKYAHKQMANSESIWMSSDVYFIYGARNVHQHYRMICAGGVRNALLIHFNSLSPPILCGALYAEARVYGERCRALL